MKNKQSNWSFMVVKKSFVDLWYYENIEEKYYNAFITVVLDKNIKKKKNYVSLSTEINGECKFCIARAATQMMLTMFGGVGDIITVYNATTGNKIEEFTFADIERHEESYNEDRVAGDRPISIEDNQKSQQVTLH